jgi:hypothetical protein
LTIDYLPLVSARAQAQGSVRPGAHSKSGYNRLSRDEIRIRDVAGNGFSRDWRGLSRMRGLKPKSEMTLPHSICRQIFPNDTIPKILRFQSLP